MNSPLREQSYLETNTPNTGTNPGKQDMEEFVRLVGPNRAVEIFGIRLVGINAEKIVMDAALRHTITDSKLGKEALEEMQRRYFLKPTQIGPRVYWRLTDNWLELTLRFIVRDRGIRETKDALSRDILREFEAAGIDLASATFEIVSLPPLRIAPASPDTQPF
jgi:hypothetical protein